jgi:hypothetical protein
MSSSVRCLIGFVVGAVGLIAGLAGAFLVLDRDHALKAPSFANRASFDEKLRLLRARPPAAAVDLLLVGSSTALHGADGAALRAVLGADTAILNVGVQDIRVHQTRFLTEFFLGRHPDVGHVVMISTTLDFHTCRPDEAAFFDPEQAAAYLDGRRPELYFHFKYLDPGGVVRRAGQLAALRAAHDTLEALSFDADGAVLLDVPRAKLLDEVWYGREIVLDPRCYGELRGLALDLRARGVPFTYVLAPMRPGYLAHRDPDGALLAALRRGVRDALAGTGAALVDAHAALAMPEEAFFDAYHLRRDRVPALSRLTAEVLEENRGHRAVTGAPPPEPSS